MTEGPLEPSTPDAELPVEIRCWRCELLTPESDPICWHCGAKRRGAEHDDASTRLDRDDARSMKAMVLSFSLLLVTGIVHAAVLDWRFGDYDEFSAEQSQQVWQQILIVEAIDTAIVVATLLALAETATPVFASPSGSFWAGVAAFPGLVAMLGLNLAYHYVLQEVLGVSTVIDEAGEDFSWSALVASCFQPAIVEEIYFRGIAIGVLRRFVGTNSAVWISALMFGLSHVSVMLSIPYMIAFGAFAGYVRVASGSLLTPIALHFLHNLAISIYEWT